ncbi:MAG: aerobic-type carbon monoxide dehydrogenase, middle subunit CoxM/CutM-like protein [Hyphomicrobiales bacterium]|nr:aerobic-type carbon monoxide dehydrogenase, middle subunit CoxM/CutM-like protein [Hyphomicrobiales bacterium]
MRPFVYERPQTEAAAADLARKGGAAFLAGGTTLLDLMKLDVLRPDTLIDLSCVRDDKLSAITADAGGLRFGALVHMAEAEEHEDVKRDYPVIAQSLMLAASQQLRNMATLGGNLLQRTRCNYFRDTSWTACNKRNPGSGCAAKEGVNRMHAVLGTSSACIATYPGDFAQALIALGAEVDTIGPRGPRSIALADLHKLPEDRPDIETALLPGEMIVSIFVPAAAYTRRSLYLKIRDRESYEFAVASAAVALDMDGDTVRVARVALGGVATVPWRSQAAEQELAGQRLDESSAMAAAEIAFADASALRDNAYKIPLGKQTLVRALLEAGKMEMRG